MAIYTGVLNLGDWATSRDGMRLDDFLFFKPPDEILKNILDRATCQGNDKNVGDFLVHRGVVRLCASLYFSMK